MLGYVMINREFVKV